MNELVNATLVGSRESRPTVKLKFRDGNKVKYSTLRGIYPYFYVNPTEKLNFPFHEKESGHISYMGKPLDKLSFTSIDQLETGKRNVDFSMESDVFYLTRFLVDSNLVFGLNRRILYFDIEVEMGKGSLDTENAPQPVIVIDAFDNFTNRHYSFTMREYAEDGIEAFVFDDEDLLLNNFFAFCNRINPDIMIGWNCLSKDTEVLTEEGWHFLSEIVNTKSNLKIATLDDKNCLEWYSPKEYFKYFFSGNLIHENSRHIDLLVTPEHRMWILPRESKTGKWEFRRAGMLPKECEYVTAPSSYQILSDQKIPKNYYIPRYEKRWRSHSNAKERIFVQAKKRIDMKVWIAFMGYFLSEGCIQPKWIQISQIRSSPHWSDINTILEKMPFKFSYHNHSFYIHSVQLVKELQKFGKDKDRYIPKEIKDLPKEYLSILFSNLVNGDGTWYPPHAISYATISDKLADDFQEIALKLGYKTAKVWQDNKIWVIYGTNKKQTELVNKNISTRTLVPYSDYVYCIGVKNERFFVRRRGKITVTGNSNNYDFPYLFNRSKRTDLFGTYHHQLYFQNTQPLDLMKTYMEFGERGGRYFLDHVASLVLNKRKTKGLGVLPHCIEDVTLTKEIDEKLKLSQLVFAFQHIVPLNTIDIMSRSGIIETFMLKKYHDQYVIPNRGHVKHIKYKGAIVRDPVKGLHENVSVLDLVSLYPSIVMHNNISPDRDIRNPGILSEAIQEIFNKRMVHKNAYKEKGDTQSGIWNTSYKFLLNAFIGILGFSNSRFYNRELAAEVTGWERKLLTRIWNFVEDKNIQLLAGDTDSFFCEYSKPLELVDEVNDMLHAEWGEEFNIDLDKQFKILFLYDKKKNYFGLTKEGNLKITGTVVNRTSCPLYIRTKLMETFKLILDKKSTKSIKEEVSKKIREQSTMDIAEWMRLSSIDPKVNTAHLKAAKNRLRLYRIPFSQGEKLPIIPTKDSHVGYLAIHEDIIDNLPEIDYDAILEKWYSRPLKEIENILNQRTLF